MKVIVFYFMILQNCLQITLSQELSTQTSENVVQKNDESSTINESTTNSATTEVLNDINPVNKPHYASLNEDKPSDDEEKNGVDYPVKTLMRLLKVKGSITDSFDGVSKIFGGMQDVGGELFGMVKDGALNVKNYLPFK